MAKLAEILGQVLKNHRADYEDEGEWSSGPPPKRPKFCQLCAGGHETKSCTDYKTKQERKRAFVSEDRCQNCGFKNHATDDCHFPPAVCGDCHEDYLVYICPRIIISDSEESDDEEEEEIMEEGELLESDEEEH